MCAFTEGARVRAVNNNRVTKGLLGTIGFLDDDRCHRVDWDDDTVIWAHEDEMEVVVTGPVEGYVSVEELKVLIRDAFPLSWETVNKLLLPTPKKKWKLVFEVESESDLDDWTDANEWYIDNFDGVKEKLISSAEVK